MSAGMSECRCLDGVVDELMRVGVGSDTKVYVKRTKKKKMDRKIVETSVYSGC
jgi:hypothetical protein